MAAVSSSLLYGPRDFLRAGEHRRGSRPWPTDRYREAFDQLPERRLYFEHVYPHEEKIILDGPLLHSRGPSQDGVLSTRSHVSLCQRRGFRMITRSATGLTPHNERLVGIDAGSDLDRALSELNRWFTKVAGDPASEWQRADPNAPTKFFRQDFHDAFVDLLAGRAHNPRPQPPAVVRGDVEPRRWLNGIYGGETVHRRIEPGLWARLHVSGWQGQEMGTWIQALVRDPAYTGTPAKVWVDAASGDGMGASYHPTDDKITELYECPAYVEQPLGNSAAETDPRTLDAFVHCGKYRPSFRTPKAHTPS